jgi:C-terminal processing protease CtpA/Prc
MAITNFGKMHEVQNNISLKIFCNIAYFRISVLFSEIVLINLNQYNKMKIKKLNLFFGIVLLSLAAISCHKNEETTINKEALSVNEFILEYMDYFYLWTDKIPANLDPKATEDSKVFFEKTRYKGNEGDRDPDTGIYKNGDRWSFITDDLQGLLDYFNGIRTTAGYMPYAYLMEEGSDKLVLVVKYVYANSPASEVGLKRGSIIMKIDGKDLTNENVNELFGKESYEITLGTFDENTGKFSLTNKTETITKREIHTNPILKSEIYEIKGVKIAYLLYNSFIHDYDNKLIAEFQNYKSAGVNELILDFRYNGGGAVSSALNIASMIAPKGTIGSVFLKKQYNSKLQQDFLNDPNYGQDYLEDNLAETAYGHSDDGGIEGTPLPNLNLSKVYILGLEGTASASELIINGLKPYMNVVTVGGTTHGKYTASVTFKNKEYTNWAIQPIIFKSANANDETDYWNGFTPDLPIGDYPLNGDFGFDVSTMTGEPMLATAIKDITGDGSLAKQKEVETMVFKGAEIKDGNSALSTTMIYDIKE